MYSSANCIYHVVQYIPGAYLSYNWKYVAFDHFHPIPPPTTPCPW